MANHCCLHSQKGRPEVRSYRRPGEGQQVRAGRRHAADHKLERRALRVRLAARPPLLGVPRALRTETHWLDQGRGRRLKRPRAGFR